MTGIEARNLEIAERLVSLYEREGPWAVERHFEEFFRPDFVWKPAVSALGDRTYVGREGFRTWQDDIFSVAEEMEQTEFEPIAIGDRVMLVLCRMRMVGKASGAPFESEYGAVYEMEDGKGVRGRAFLSHAEARAEAERLAGVGADA